MRIPRFFLVFFLLCAAPVQAGINDLLWAYSALKKAQAAAPLVKELINCPIKNFGCKPFNAYFLPQSYEGGHQTETDMPEWSADGGRIYVKRNEVVVLMRFGPEAINTFHYRPRFSPDPHPLALEVEIIEHHDGTPHLQLQRVERITMSSAVEMSMDTPVLDSVLNKKGVTAYAAFIRHPHHIAVGEEVGVRFVFDKEIPADTLLNLNLQISADAGSVTGFVNAVEWAERFDTRNILNMKQRVLSYILPEDQHNALEHYVLETELFETFQASEFQKHYCWYRRGGLYSPCPQQQTAASGTTVSEQIITKADLPDAIQKATELAYAEATGSSSSSTGSSGTPGEGGEGSTEPTSPNHKYRVEMHSMRGSKAGKDDWEYSLTFTKGSVSDIDLRLTMKENEGKGINGVCGNIYYSDDRSFKKGDDKKIEEECINLKADEKRSIYKRKVDISDLDVGTHYFRGDIVYPGGNNPSSEDDKTEYLKITITPPPAGYENSICAKAGFTLKECLRKVLKR